MKKFEDIEIRYFDSEPKAKRKSEESTVGLKGRKVDKTSVEEAASAGARKASMIA